MIDKLVPNRKLGPKLGRLSPSKRFALLIVGVVIIAPVLEAALAVQVIGYFDELAVATLFVSIICHRLLSRHGLRRVPGAGYYVGFLAAGVISAIATGVDPLLLLSG